ncbi:MAG: N-acetylneuraminate synthase family protein [Cyclobacteriaceae bacterium]|nr:N-acetylneuraminate synthase family protein [Cyclobacteriaceae bacterium]
MRQLKIGNRIIDDSTDCFVTAEIGHNHMGRLDVAMEMVKVAKECGADAVKLQKRNNKTLFATELLNQPYDNPNSYGATYGEHREFLEFGESQYKELQVYAKSLDITFFATAFDHESADFLEKLDMPLYKLASADITNTPLLKHVAGFKKPMILSSGGATMEDVKRAYEIVSAYHSNFAILQCTAAYPCDFEQLDLRVIETYRKQFPNILIGLSDHDNGIAMAPVAYVLGARFIEKHFTLNRANKGTDHAFSLEPTGLRKMIRDLKRTKIALGDGTKRQFENEKKPLLKMAKSIFTNKAMKAGEVISEGDVAYKIPGDGIPPHRYMDVIGKKLKTNVTKEHKLSFEDLV